MKRTVLVAAVCALVVHVGAWPAPQHGNTCAASLRRQSICEDADGSVSVFFQGEFGTEFATALPAAFAAWRQDKLRETRGCGADMRALYYFSPNHTDVPGCVRRYYKETFASFNWAPHTTRHAGRELWHPPPLRAHYRKLPFNWPAGTQFDRTRPVVVIHNKYNIEWNGAPVNFISLATLGALIRTLQLNDVQVIYTRLSGKGIDDAESHALPFADFAWLRSNATHVILLADIVDANPTLSLNEVQLRVFAHVDHAISVQGGPTLFLSQFVQGGDLVVLHRKGLELEHHEYTRLFEQFDGAALTVVNTDKELVQAVTRLARFWSQE